MYMASLSGEIKAQRNLARRLTQVAVQRLDDADRRRGVTVQSTVILMPSGELFLIVAGHDQVEVLGNIKDDD